MWRRQRFSKYHTTSGTPSLVSRLERSDLHLTHVMIDKIKFQMANPSNSIILIQEQL